MDEDAPPEAPEVQPTTPAPATPARAAAPAVEPPPAAVIVATGPRTEREIELEAELQRERDRAESLDGRLAEEQETRKQREIRVSELEDENHRIKSATGPARPAVRPPAGFGFFRA